MATCDDFPIAASREAMIEFVELKANGDVGSQLAVCRPMKGFPADKDLKTQYEWTKAWHKTRLRELGWNTDEYSDTDNDEDNQGTAARSGVEDSDDDVRMSCMPKLKTKLFALYNFFGCADIC